MPLYDSATLYDSAVVTYDGRNTWDTSPSISIYLAFDGTPYQVTPVWTDVTGYVSQVDTDRSRSDDFSAFVSTATVVFRNETQLFSPFNTSGTYYGKLKPRLQIKIEATVLGNIYPVFRGFCAGFPVSNTEAGYASTVTVQCFDALALLATELVADYVYDYTIALSPTNYWRCDDGPIASANGITDSVGIESVTGAVNNLMSTVSAIKSGVQTPAILTNSSAQSAIKSVPADPALVSTIGTATNVPSGRAFNNGRADVTFTPDARNAATSFTVTSSLDADSVAKGSFISLIACICNPSMSLGLAPVTGLTTLFNIWL